MSDPASPRPRRSSSAAVDPDHPDLVRLRSRTPSRTADIVSRVCDPLVAVLATLVVLGVRSAGPAGLGWAGLAAVFCVAGPEAALAWSVRRGRALDRDLVVADQRHVPLLIAVASVALGVVVLFAAGAPAPVTALVLATLAGVAVMAAVTRVVKASFHAGVLASMLVVLALDGVPIPVCLALAPLVVLVGWARVRAGRHTRAQIVLGVAICAVVVGGVFAVAS